MSQPPPQSPGRRQFLLSAAAAACALGAGIPLRVRAQACSRLALVIGNAGYKTTAALRSPIKDAQLMASTLQKVGFQVDLRTDLALAEMTQGIDGWLRKATSAAVRLVFFSGHGAQYRGGNYLLPVDVDLRSEDDLPRAAFHVDDVVDRFSRFDTGVNLLVLDACRSVPRVGPGQPKGDKTATWTPGFTPGAVPQGTLVAWATSKGAVALDDPRGGNSLFTRYFAQHLGVAGLPVEDVLKATREAVKRASGGLQVPEDHSTLTGKFYFVPPAGPGCGARG